MNELSIKIDGVEHRYVKVSISRRACAECSLGEYCRQQFHTYNKCMTGCAAQHLCRIFDLSGRCRPTGNYGRFEIVEK